MKNNCEKMDNNRHEDNPLRLKIIFVCIDERVKIEGRDDRPDIGTRCLNYRLIYFIIICTKLKQI